MYVVKFPGRNADSICWKYTSTHQKQVPTGDPNMPEDVRLAKKVKYTIRDQAQLGGRGGV